jgi:hypothetical protein
LHSEYMKDSLASYLKGELHLMRLAQLAGTPFLKGLNIHIAIRL